MTRTYQYKIMKQNFIDYWLPMFMIYVIFLKENLSLFNGKYFKYRISKIINLMLKHKQVFIKYRLTIWCKKILNIFTLLFIVYLSYWLNYNTIIFFTSIYPSAALPSTLTLSFLEIASISLKLTNHLPLNYCKILNI
jgi:flagellar biosynthesis protein FlhB